MEFVDEIFVLSLYISGFIRAKKNLEGSDGDKLPPLHFDSTEGSFDGGQHIDDILKEFDDYGSTPPRTRISRRQRERRQREKEELW